MSTRSPTSTSRSSSSSNNAMYGYGYQPMQRTSGDVPTSVRHLLASTKELQATLRQWGEGQATESQVSDVFVRVGTEFHLTVNAFTYHGIDLNHVNSFLKELRVILERCLSEEPSPAILQQYMPELRRVLYMLLKGLQERQSAWQNASGRASFIASHDRP